MHGIWWENEPGCFRLLQRSRLGGDKGIFMSADQLMFFFSEAFLCSAVLLFSRIICGQLSSREAVAGRQMDRPSWKIGLFTSLFGTHSPFLSVPHLSLNDDLQSNFNWLRTPNLGFIFLLFYSVRFSTFVQPELHLCRQPGASELHNLKKSRN